MRRFATAWIALLLPVALLPAADTLEGRWKLVAAEDVRANGEVARKPWGEHPVGSIVVQAAPQGAACYLQIMCVHRHAEASTLPSQCWNR